MTPFARTAVETKNPLSLERQRAKECLMSDLLSTPYATRQIAVMMVAMDVVNEVHE